MVAELEEFFEHHGVKGMKWGIRNAVNRGRSGIESRSKKRKHKSVDYKAVQKIKKNKVRALTNKQLQTHNTRRNLEKQYRNLSPSKVKQGRKFVKGMLGAATTAGTVYTLANSPFGKTVMARGAKFVAKKG